MVSKFDARQSEYVGTLPQVSPTANPQMDAVSLSFNDSLGALFEDRNIILTGGGVLTYTAGAPSQLTTTSPFVLYVNSRVAGGAPVAITLSAGPYNFSANGRMLYAVINRTAGTAVVTADAASLPSMIAANHEVFLLAKRADVPTERLYLKNGQSMGNGDSFTLGGGGSSLFNDANFQIFDNLSPTKTFQFQASTITAGNNRIFSVPDANTTLAGLSVAQTWTAEQTFSSQSRFANGTVGEPSIAWTADDDTTGTGFYRDATNSVGFASNGIDVGGFTTTGLRIPNGTVAAPGLKWNTAITSGIYSTGSGLFGISVQNSSKMTMSTSVTNFVSNPVTVTNTTLTVNSNTNADHFKVATATSTVNPTMVLERTAGTLSRWDIYIPTGSTELRFFSTPGATDRVVFSAAGDITADGFVGAAAGTNTAPGFVFTADGNTGMYRSAADEISWTCNGTQRMILSSGGNLSIDGALTTTSGASSLGGGLSVAGNIVTNNQVFTGSGSATSPGFTFNTETNLGWYRISAGTIGFATGNGTPFRITSSGNLQGSGGGATLNAPRINTRASTNAFSVAWGVDNVMRFFIDNVEIASLPLGFVG